jgi:hypothetical protein
MPLITTWPVISWCVLHWKIFQTKYNVCWCVKIPIMLHSDEWAYMTEVYLAKRTSLLHHNRHAPERFGPKNTATYHDSMFFASKKFTFLAILL